MTLNIGICDDRLDQIEIINRYLKRMNNLNITGILESDNPDIFLRKLEDFKPDILFLDIDMGQTSGIDIAEKIKFKYPEVILIFITGHEKYAIKAFQLRAFHYLLKPITEDQFKDVLEDGLNEIERRNSSTSKVLIIRKKNEALNIKYDEISYFEKVGRKIRVYMDDNSIEYNGNFNELLNELDDGFFIRCHQGYIANSSKIVGLKEKRLLMNCRVELPVSRSYMNNVRILLANKLFRDKVLT